MRTYINGTSVVAYQLDIRLTSAHAYYSLPFARDTDNSERDEKFLFSKLSSNNRYNAVLPDGFQRNGQERLKLETHNAAGRSAG